MLTRKQQSIANSLLAFVGFAPVIAALVALGYHILTRYPASLFTDPLNLPMKQDVDTMSTGSVKKATQLATLTDEEFRQRFGTPDAIFVKTEPDGAVYNLKKGRLPSPRQLWLEYNFPPRQPQRQRVIPRAEIEEKQILTLDDIRKISFPKTV